MDGKKLRKIRNKLQMTQVKLAAELGVTPNTIACWERGVNRIGQVKMLSLALERLQRERNDK